MPLYPPDLQATVVATSPVTITGVTAATLALAGPVVTPSAGQAYAFAAWGTVTTSADTDTINAQVYYGGTGGTNILGSGAKAPDGSATVSGASVRFTGSVTFLSATEASCTMQMDLDYFPATVVQNTTAVSGAAEQLVLALTPSDSAMSITVNGGYWQRIA